MGRNLQILDLNISISEAQIEKHYAYKKDMYVIILQEQEDARKQEAIERKKKEKQYKQNEADSVMKGKKAFFLKKCK